MSTEERADYNAGYNTEYEHVAVGSAVHSADGHDLGAVKELLGPYFKIDAPMAPDYWLPLDVVNTAHATAVVLAVNLEALGGYEVSQDALEAERAAAAAAHDHLVDTDGEYTDRDAAVEAAAIVWGPDEWPVVRGRLMERDLGYDEVELDRMQEEDPQGLRARFVHLFDEADRSATELARTVEENT